MLYRKVGMQQVFSNELCVARLKRMISFQVKYNNPSDRKVAQKFFIPCMGPVTTGNAGSRIKSGK